MRISCFISSLTSNLRPSSGISCYQMKPKVTMPSSVLLLRSASLQTPKEILDPQGAVYTMKQSPTQKYRDFVRGPAKGRAITLPDAEVLGNCVNGALPTLKPHLAMATAATTSELLTLPIVVNNMVIDDDPTLSMLQILNDKLDLVSVNQATQATQCKSVSFVRSDHSPSPGPSHTQACCPSAHRSRSPSLQGFQLPHRWCQPPVSLSPCQGRLLRSSQWWPQGQTQWRT